MSNDLFAKPTSRPQPGVKVSPAKVDKSHDVDLGPAFTVMILAALVFVLVMVVLAVFVGKK